MTRCVCWIAMHTPCSWAEVTITQCVTVTKIDEATKRFSNLRFRFILKFCSFQSNSWQFLKIASGWFGRYKFCSLWHSGMIITITHVIAALMGMCFLYNYVKMPNYIWNPHVLQEILIWYCSVSHVTDRVDQWTNCQKPNSFCLSLKDLRLVHTRC